MKRARDRASDEQACPCGGGRYADCCGRFHRGEALPATAEQLMRSRYSAYALGDTRWLRETWHRTTCPAELDDTLGADGHGQHPKWLGLEIRRHVQRDDAHAEVEFVARFKSGGRAGRLHERSRFVREPRVPGDVPRWWYVDGDMEEG